MLCIVSDDDKDVLKEARMTPVSSNQQYACEIYTLQFLTVPLYHYTILLVYKISKYNTHHTAEKNQLIG